MVSIFENENSDSSTPLSNSAIAFSSGSDLYTYFAWVESIWMTPMSDAKVKIDRFLFTFATRIVENLSKLDLQERSVVWERVRSLESKFTSFQLSVLPQLLSKTERESLQEKYWKQVEFDGANLEPDDYPLDEDFAAGFEADLFDSAMTADLASSILEIEKLAKSVFEKCGPEYLTLFRLGFSVVRPEQPLRLDRIFPDHTNPLRFSDPARVAELALRGIFDEARLYSASLNSISPDKILSRWDLRDRINEALKTPTKETIRGRLGLTFYPDQMMVKRDNIEEPLVLMGFDKLWILFKLLACANELDRNVSSKKLRKEYFKGSIGNRDGKWSIKTPVSRLRKIIRVLHLDIKNIGKSAYTLVELDEQA